MIIVVNPKPKEYGFREAPSSNGAQTLKRKLLFNSTLRMLLSEIQVTSGCIYRTWYINR